MLESVIFCRQDLQTYNSILVNRFIRLENYYNINSSKHNRGLHQKKLIGPYAFLPVLDTTERCGVKKAVVRMN